MGIAEELYDIEWYRLPASYQKRVSYAINSVQNGPVLTIGPLCKIDFSTAATVSFSSFQIQFQYLSNDSEPILMDPIFQLTKSIYRFTMLLLTMFN